jgi:ribosomal protein L16/L10AE
MVNIKRHKGRIPIPVGGSTKGTTLAFGEWGIRIKGNGVRFSAKQLLAAEEVLKRKMKVIKGAKVYLRVFTDIPVCIKVSLMFVSTESFPPIMVRVDENIAREVKPVWAKERDLLTFGPPG